MCPKTGCPTSVSSASATSRCAVHRAQVTQILSARVPQQGIFYEAVTNQILDDLVAACAPRRMTVIGDFTARGGITTKVTAEYSRRSERRRVRQQLAATRGALEDEPCRSDRRQRSIFTVFARRRGLGGRRVPAGARGGLPRRCGSFMGAARACSAPPCSACCAATPWSMATGTRRITPGRYRGHG